MKTKTVEAKFRIVTPMFLGGANHESDTIRPPSVKGALRFWWRALNWGRFYSKKQGNVVEAMKALHDEEAKLFGLAAKTVNGKQVAGQGCFLLTVQHGKMTTVNKGDFHPDFKPTRNIDRNRIDNNHLAAARYLGYGLMTAFGENAGKLDRSCINAYQEFTVKLLFKDRVEDSIVEAIKAMGLLGGLGSRTRRGMGSIALEALKAPSKDWSGPTSSDSYDQMVQGLFENVTLPVDMPEFSAFSNQTRIDRLLSAASPYDVLDQFGSKMLFYRSWGRTKGGGSGKSTVLGQDSEQQFNNDHRWCKGMLTATNPNYHPRRVMFGLPHNYDRQQLPAVKAEIHERRSSPLMFHVHRLSDTEYIGVSVLLKSRFLPDGENINAGGISVPAKVDDWVVLTNFLNGKVGNPATTVDRFPAPDKKAVLP